MDNNSPLQAALERWQIARDALAHFEALHLTLLLVSRESDVQLTPATLPPDVLAAWRTAEANAHATYVQLLSLLAQAIEPTPTVENSNWS